MTEEELYQEARRVGTDALKLVDTSAPTSSFGWFSGFLAASHSIAIDWLNSIEDQEQRQRVAIILVGRLLDIANHLATPPTRETIH